MEIPTQNADDLNDDDLTTKLPEWCDVYRGLSDQEIDELEKVVFARADLSRPWIEAWRA